MGGYARVVLVRKTCCQRPTYLAVKIYDKVKTKLKSKVTNIPREISIMLDIDHANVCRLEEHY